MSPNRANALGYLGGFDHIGTANDKAHLRGRGGTSHVHKDTGQTYTQIHLQVRWKVTVTPKPKWYQVSQPQRSTTDNKTRPITIVLPTAQAESLLAAIAPTVGVLIDRVNQTVLGQADLSTPANQPDRLVFSPAHVVSAEPATVVLDERGRLQGHLAGLLLARSGLSDAVGDEQITAVVKSLKSMVRKALDRSAGAAGGTRSSGVRIGEPGLADAQLGQWWWTVAEQVWADVLDRLAGHAPSPRHGGEDGFPSGRVEAFDVYDRLRVEVGSLAEQPQEPAGHDELLRDRQAQLRRALSWLEAWGIADPWRAIRAAELVSTFIASEWRSVAPVAATGRTGRLRPATPPSADGREPAGTFTELSAPQPQSPTTTSGASAGSDDGSLLGGLPRRFAAVAGINPQGGAENCVAALRSFLRWRTRVWSCRREEGAGAVCP